MSLCFCRHDIYATGPPRCGGHRALSGRGNAGDGLPGGFPLVSSLVFRVKLGGNGNCLPNFIFFQVIYA
uniref:Uncharacterized protein n=1 Tax=Rhizophora mucronata TaxID=61149 RepID=A0A2P2NLT5_RHIMU